MTKRHQSRERRPWRRRATEAPAEAVLHELQRRELRTLEDCRLAWREGADPLALCVAVTKADLPDWLADALLVLLMADGGVPSLEELRVGQFWAHREAEANDAARATAVAAARLDDAGTGRPARKLDAALQLGEQIARERAGTPAVSPDAARKSYDRVRDGLASNQGIYWQAEGIMARLTLALERRAGRK